MVKSHWSRDSKEVKAGAMRILADEPSGQLGQQVQRPRGGHFTTRQDLGQSRCFLLYSEKPLTIQIGSRGCPVKLEFQMNHD